NFFFDEMKNKPITKKYPNSSLDRFGGWTFHCIDAHTCGNPVRLVAEGGPELEGNIMSGSILYPPHDPQNDFAVLFIETSGCLPMCGHGTIGTITIAIEEGLITPKTPGKIRMEAPAG